MKKTSQLLLKYRFPLILTAAILLLFLCGLFRIIDFQELQGLDLKFRLRGQAQAHSDITVVTIDDASIQAFGLWPWPRTVHAAFIDVIDRYQPKAIFFDVLFTESAQDPSGDEKFAAAIKKSAHIILPYFYIQEPFHISSPIPVLREAAAALGYVNVDPDSDSKIRKIRLHFERKGERYTHPSVLLTQKEFPEYGRIDQPIWINYPGGSSSFRSVSFGRAIQLAGTGQDEEMDKLFKGKYVLIGHTAAGTVDLKATPHSPIIEGIYVQASILHTLLQAKFLREFPKWAELLLLIGLGFFTVSVTQKRKPFIGLAISAGISIGYALINFILFAAFGWILPLFLPMVVVSFISFGLSLIFRYVEAIFLKERSERELSIAAQIQESFLPKLPGKINGIDASFSYKFAKTVGGDLLDWMKLENDQFAFCIGDVSGKGVPAALFGAKCIADLRNISKEGMKPHEVLMKLNQMLLADEISGVFLTFFYGIIDVRNKKLSYASAGHEPCLHYKKSDKKIELLGKSEGMPLALFAEAEYETREVSLTEGDSLLLFTDGVRELRNLSGKEFGVDALSQLQIDLMGKDMSGPDMVAGISEHLKIYHKGTQPHDDSTLFFVKLVPMEN